MSQWLASLLRSRDKLTSLSFWKNATGLRTADGIGRLGAGISRPPAGESGRRQKSLLMLLVVVLAGPAIVFSGFDVGVAAE